MLSNSPHGDESGASGETRTAAVDRRTVIKSGIVTVGGVGLAGCLGDDGDGDTTDTETSDDSTGTTTNGDVTNVAIISSSAGFGDQAFNTLAVEGLESAAEEYNIEINQVEETNTSNYQSVQSDLASSSNPDYDLIVLVGYEHSPGLETNAQEYSGQNWMLINDHIDQSNVAGRIWANHEMSYLAGVLAGTMTTRDFSHEGSSTRSGNAHVGFVGGVDGPLINAFERAYRQGAKWVNSDVQVSDGYIGNYEDVQTATDIANSQYDDGADIVYQAAAAAGRGVFPAAQNSNRFAIGVDADQSVTLSEYEDVILGSAVKYINEGTRRVASAVAEDDFSSVAGRRVLGLEQEAVDLVLGQAIGSELPDVVTQNVQDAKDGILNGDITVPCSASGCQN